MFLWAENYTCSSAAEGFQPASSHPSAPSMSISFHMRFLKSVPLWQGSNWYQLLIGRLSKRQMCLSVWRLNRSVVDQHFCFSLTYLALGHVVRSSFQFGKASRWWTPQGQLQMSVWGDRLMPWKFKSNSLNPTPTDYCKSIQTVKLHNSTGLAPRLKSSDCGVNQE